MDTFHCRICKNEKYIYDQEKLNIRGILNQSNMDRIAIDTENISIEEIDYVFYYFNEWDLIKIRDSGNVAGMPRLWCEDCIIDSIEDTYISGNPHYGNGVYLTLHENLINANDEVKCAHGQDVSNRKYRAKFEVKDNNYLKKILNTGGVLRTIENEWNTDLIFLNTLQRDVAIFKGIEKYENGEWVFI